MPDPLEYRIYNRQQHVFTAELTGPVELGRQDKGEEGPYHHHPITGKNRLIVARFDEDNISRKHVLIEPQTGGQIRVNNLSKSLPIQVQNGGDVAPLAACDFEPPLVFSFGTKTVRVQPLATPAPAASFQCLAQATVLPGAGSSFRADKTSLAFPAAKGLDVEAIVRWLQTTMVVLQSAASSEDFFAQAARAVVDLVGLDSGGVVMRERSAWRIQALESAAGVRREEDWQPSRQILTKVQDEKRTFWEVPGGQVSGSLVGVKAVVAAPILNRQGEVIGVLYGDRRQEQQRVITKLEAMLVEMLATGVAAGLARLEQEQAALRTRVQFEQFFTPELSRQLLSHPDLLQCRETEVTMLVCDIRGFSRISERHGPGVTGDWISDTMTALSECVLAEQGVLVDYTGDEVMAMWGAPVSQPDHPRRACRAGLAMLHALPALNESWQPRLGALTEIGIGINTGLARVGNVGSRIKFKYGPLGNPVNLASRVQGATKYFHCPLLITEATQAHLGDGFFTRRLCQVRVVNVVNPVPLFELVREPTPTWTALQTTYEQALGLFGKRDFESTTGLLNRLLADHPDDGPSQILLSRARQYQQEPANFDPIWELPGK